MTGLKRALYTFWSQFGVPAYLTDCVPDDAQLPYITYNVASSPALGITLLTAFNYHAREPDGNTARARLADAIAAAIPERGTKIPLDGGGFVTLFRNTDFQSIYQDPEDLDVVGLRTSVEVHFYSM